MDSSIFPKVACVESLACWLQTVSENFSSQTELAPEKWHRRTHPAAVQRGWVVVARSYFNTRSVAENYQCYGKLAAMQGFEEVSLHLIYLNSKLYAAYSATQWCNCTVFGSSGWKMKTSKTLIVQNLTRDFTNFPDYFLTNRVI